MCVNVCVYALALACVMRDVYVCVMAPEAAGERDSLSIRNKGKWIGKNEGH